MKPKYDHFALLKTNLEASLPFLTDMEKLSLRVMLEAGQDPPIAPLAPTDPTQFPPILQKPIDELPEKLVKLIPHCFRRNNKYLGDLLQTNFQIKYGRGVISNHIDWNRTPIELKGSLGMVDIYDKLPRLAKIYLIPLLGATPEQYRPYMSVFWQKIFELPAP